MASQPRSQDHAKASVLLASNVPKPIARHSRVRLKGLSKEVLNGAEGFVWGDLVEDKGRWPVMLTEPAGAVAAHPDGVNVKPENMDKLPLQKAVELYGVDMKAGYLPEHEAGCCTGLREGTPKASQESMAVYLMIDPVSGFAPPEIQMRGLGKGDLHEYNGHLMDVWEEFESDMDREVALTPAAFQTFMRERKKKASKDSSRKNTRRKK
eukprot:gene1594-32982_t